MGAIELSQIVSFMVGAITSGAFALAMTMRF